MDRETKLWLSWAKLRLSLSYSFINFKLTFKNISGSGNVINVFNAN